MKHPKIWSAKGKQVKMVEMILTSDKDLKDICKDVGITPPTWYNWLERKEFQEYYNKQRMIHMSARMADIDRKLMDVATSGGPKSVSAIKIVYEKMGEIQNELAKVPPITINFEAIQSGTMLRPKQIESQIVEGTVSNEEDKTDDKESDVENLVVSPSENGNK